MNIGKNIWLLVMIIIPCFVSGQSKVFKSRIDTSFEAKNKYIEAYDYESFFNSGIAEDEFDVTHYDQELLNAAIFFTINEIRAKKSRQLYTYSKDLEEVAYNYVQIKTRRRLEGNKTNIERIEKDFPEVSEMFDFSGKLVSFNIATINAIDYKPNKEFYYDKKDSYTTIKLFYGEKRRFLRNDKPGYRRASFWLSEGYKKSFGFRQEKANRDTIL